MSKHIVTFAPPTPNGGLHVGHLSGPYLAADVYTRTRRLLGDEVLFVSYSDDYQSYLSRKARELGVSNESLAADNYKAISQALRDFSIVPDAFISAHNNEFFLNAVSFFRRQAKDFIKVRKVPVPYCEDCQLWGYEANGRGECLNCGEISDHSQCESCAMPPDITGLRTVECIKCKKPMTYVRVQREYLQLNSFVDHLKSLYIDQISRPKFYNFIQQILAVRDLDWPIDRPGDYGIPCRDSASEVIHTWFAGIAGYMAATDSLGQKDIWYENDLNIAHFIGFDCSFSHGIVYPSLLKAAGIKAQSFNVYTNEFLKLNGHDFSTSRGIAIWANDILEEVDSDYLRIYLATRAPENSTKNFDTFEFVETINKVFCKNFSDITQAGLRAGAPAPLLKAEVLQYIENLKQNWLDATSTRAFSMQKMAVCLMNGIDYLNTLKDAGSSDLGISIVAWACLAQPIMPNVSFKLLHAAGVSSETARDWVQGNLPLRDLVKPIHHSFSLHCKSLEQDRINRLINGV